MKFSQKLKRAFRTYVYADHRFSPDIRPHYRQLPLTGRYFDSGTFPVVYTSSARYAPLGIANHLGRTMRNEPALFLVWFSWTMESLRGVRYLATAVSAYRYRRPRHRVILLCNTEAEERAFTAAGLDAILCNHNALLDEETFRPLAEGERAYDAVYNAAMVPWKAAPSRAAHRQMRPYLLREARLRSRQHDDASRRDAHPHAGSRLRQSGGG